MEGGGGGARTERVHKKDTVFSTVLRTKECQQTLIDGTAACTSPEGARVRIAATAAAVAAAPAGAADTGNVISDAVC